MATYRFFNRDISWLSFNHRVLEVAYDEGLPLYERIKFLAIYSNNLEEFYRVRVSYYRELERSLDPEHPKYKSVKPDAFIREINKIVSRHQIEFNELFYNRIIPKLEEIGIELPAFDARLNAEQEAHAHSIFSHEVLPAVQPILLVKKRIRPFLRTGQIYIAIQLYTKQKTLGSIKVRTPRYALLKLPTDHDISRFIQLPVREGRHSVMFLEDLIMRYAHEIFPGFHINNWYTIKITRDADLDYEDYDNEDLIEAIEQLEQTRAVGRPNRFQFNKEMPENMLHFLLETLDISHDTIVKGGRTNNFRHFFSFPNPFHPQHELENIKPIKLPVFENAASMLQVIENQDVLLSFPYQSFEYFISFLQEAGHTDDVESIKITQYRVASNSAVVNSLIRAALNGKDVTVFVELKARFDEEANLQYAREMKHSGIKIIYFLPGLKVHSKVALIKRKAGPKGENRDLSFIGTGNFNEKTARLYCDHGYFTANADIISDLNKLFSYLEHQTPPEKFDKILVPNFNMTETFKKLIDKEIKQVQKGDKAYIIIKVNGLEDPKMISELYKASEAGVKIDCLVRGVNCLIPNKKYSKNIRIIRIVDRYLEHARVFYFYAGGKEKVYIGSADWMKRNLYRRIECVIPIPDKKLKQELIDILNIQLNDNVSARLVDEHNVNQIIEGGKKNIRTQYELFKYFKNKYLSSRPEEK